MKQKIAIFGGSFDPFHTDHLEIINECINTLNFDFVWVLPTFLSPFKIKVHATDKHRINMINIAIKDLKNVTLNTFEIDKKESNTFKTVSYFIKNNPDFDFEFIMGSDQVGSFERWYNHDELKKIIKFVVFKRNNDVDLNIVKNNGWDLREFKNKNLSSSRIRSLINIDGQIEELNQYAVDNLLFIEERLSMTKKRFDHSINVGITAKELALKFDKDNSNIALIAGTLHDVAKELSDSELKLLIEGIDVELLKEPKPVWHSFAGRKLLQTKWKITDNKILDAVFKHTVGSENMSTLDKIVFCADKISSERDYDGVEKFRSLVFENLDAGFKALLKQQYDVAVKKHGINNVGNQLLKTYKKYIN
ncbi:nicotinate-nucleotide adenylyltransferase [Spiroplasma endosymbiont of Othius punctulatus]|uniref:nicotinate-nucleotide adenylyltransferase n=1 Tax=Spiroplasma endosymbiont of Othius punctulatus TaxID=3066289 RepID=UPI0030CD964C